MGSLDDKYPIRGTFFGCCALAITPTASITNTNRIDKTPAFFIADTVRYVSRGAVLEETEIYDGRRQVFVEWENQIFSLEMELIDATIKCTGLRKWRI
jgi:hypothetical protein